MAGGCGANPSKVTLDRFHYMHEEQKHAAQGKLASEFDME